MTGLQERFVELSKRYEAAKDDMKAMKHELAELMEAIGVGEHFQDGDGTVYMVVKPAGTFISFDTVGYERTRREGEAKGSMSMKKADELGYQVK